MVRDGEDPTEINALAILGADPDVRDIAALERLRTMAAVAPRVRSLTEAQRSKKLRRESGASTTVGEVVDAQLARANIELDTEPRDTDLWKPCAGCGQPIERGRAKRCDECEHPPCLGGCGKRAPQGCMSPSKVAKRAKRHGPQWRCTECATAAQTPEQKSEASRKASAARTPEQNRELGRKGGRKANASRSPEQKREIGRKGAAARWTKRAPQ